MGKKLYEETQSGGIRFKSGRKPWEVRIPCYLYDIWLPLIGSTALGVYGLYCRLAREGTVKAITLQDIANACRVGRTTLDKINDVLEKYGFIAMTKPKGWKRLAHFTTEFEILDPPEEVSAEAIKELAPPRGYQPVTTWLVEPSEVPDRISGSPDQDADEVLDGTPNVVTLGLEPLDVVLSADADSDLPLPLDKSPSYTPGPGKLVSCVDPDTDEEVGEADWRTPRGQIASQAFEATGRTRRRYSSKAEWNKMQRIERMIENGELPLEFWNNRIWCATNHRWSFPKLLQFTLSEDSLRDWERKQA